MVDIDELKCSKNKIVELFFYWDWGVLFKKKCDIFYLLDFDGGGGEIWY